MALRKMSIKSISQKKDGYAVLVAALRGVPVVFQLKESRGSHWRTTAVWLPTNAVAGFIIASHY